jgi:uncharacterized coiled-coil protein SlyX
MQILRLFILILLATGIAPTAAEVTIKKCQDASGTWHYGDYAAAECERAKITEIDGRGLKVDERAPPPTQEELDAKRDAATEAKEAKRVQARQRELDLRLLDTYDTEQSLIRARDERAAAFNQSILSDESFRKQLSDELVELEAHSAKPQDLEILRQQIAEYDRVIAGKRRDLDNLLQRFNKDLERFRQLQGSPADAAAR